MVEGQFLRREGTAAVLAAIEIACVDVATIQLDRSSRPLVIVQHPDDLGHGIYIRKESAVSVLKESAVEKPDEASSEPGVETEVDVKLLQPFAGGDDEMDPVLRERLKKAGARTGGVTVSLKWDSTDDLDLSVTVPMGVDIWFLAVLAVVVFTFAVTVAVDELMSAVIITAGFVFSFCVLRDVAHRTCSLTQQSGLRFF